jgi:hypothetical protein
MCYSLRASLVALSAAAVGCLLLLRREPAIALLFGYLSLMQLFDAVFWLDPTRTRLNAAATKAAMIVNHLQPLAFAAVTRFVQGVPLRAPAVVALGAYAVCAAAYTAVHWRRVDYTLPVPNPGGRASLLWKWNYQAGTQLVYGLYLTSVVLLALLHYAWPLNAVLTGLLVATFAASIHRFKSSADVGRMWCHMGAFVPVVLAAWLIARGD